MIISKLHLINFGKFTNHEIYFDRNINIFYGLNEAGKTTIVDAIAGVLFGFSGRRDDVKILRARYAPRLNSTVYKAGLSLAVDNLGDIYIERDFLSNKAEVFTLQDDLKNTSGFSVHNIVNESLGVKTIQLFRSTMLIRQEEMAQLNTAEVSDMLTRKIMSGDQTTSLKSIFQTLGRKYLELNKGILRNVGNPGPIRQCQDEINRLTGQLESMEKLNAEYAAMLTKAEILEETIFDLQTRVQNAEKTISAYRKKAELTKQCNNLLERQQIILAKTRNINQVKAELAEIDGYLATKEPYRNQISEAALNQITNLEIKIERLQEREKLSRQQLEYYSILTEELQDKLQAETVGINNHTNSQTYTTAKLMEVERLAGQTDELNRQLKLPLILGVGLLLSLLSAAGLVLISGQWRIWLMILLSTGLGLLVTGLISLKTGTKSLASCRKKISDITGDLDLEAFRNKVYAFEAARKRIYALENQLAKIDLRKYREQVNQTDMELQQSTLKMENLLAQAGTFSSQGFRDLYDNYWEARRRRSNLEQDAARLSDVKNEAGLNEELSEITVNIINLEAENSLITADITEEQFIRFVQEQADKREQLSTAQINQAKIHTAIADIERYVLNHHDRWDLENTLLERQTELETLMLKKNGIAEAVKMLRDSWREVQSGIAPVIGERASGIVSAITETKYLNIEPVIKETEFKFAAAVKGNKDKVAPEMLSAGTRDQVYLSVRLAIAEFLAEGKKFPLILDDPLVNFDEFRLKNTVNLLEQIAEYHQVILFTKDPLFHKTIAGEKVRRL